LEIPPQDGKALLGAVHAKQPDTHCRPASSNKTDRVGFMAYVDGERLKARDGSVAVYLAPVEAMDTAGGLARCLSFPKSPEYPNREAEIDALLGFWIELGADNA
jgi:hypothetical protein